MQIAHIKLKNNLILAPMSGVNDIAFRVLCKNYGAGLICSEMICADAILKSQIFEEFKTTKQERPLSIQIFGSDPKIIAQAAKRIEKYADVIDINIGCPAHKITKIGAGSDLLNHPKLIKQIIVATKKSIKKPITAKIRLKKTIKETLEIAVIIEKAGADALTIHSRTQKQGYLGKSDWNTIKHIKEKLTIPIIANGDIADFDSYQHALKQTQANAVMIGRAAIARPPVFTDILRQKGSKFTRKEQLQIFKNYYKLYKKYKMQDFTRLKQHALWLMKGFSKSTLIRKQITETKTEKDLLKITDC